MSPDQEHRLEEVFSAARALPPQEQAAFLERVCGGDAELRRGVDSLLEAYEEAGEFLRPSVALSTPNGQMEKPGDRVGRYKLLEQIGEGGFGVVWMAEQEEPVRRRVALKIIKLGMDTREVVARFEAERQALAMMDHPNIARVFDGGATDTGRPYFVMELVKGVPITHYCDASKLPTLARLQLFMQVCHAIQHAHQKGVIHRDLKPSNILVTVQDDKPVPKVIDFGVAKATQARLTEKTLFTRFNQWIGTPAYMSPEQAGLGSLDVDTRSDVYSLGVLLYELLTGRTPFDTQKLLAAGYDAVMRTIREEEPPMPSTRLSTLAREEMSAVAAQRGADPEKLNRLVRGDLDWVVMKALEKDRQRRYETAAAFARDLEHYLHREPVSAAAPSGAYRARRFIARNRMAVGFSAALVLTLIASTVFSAWQAVRATRASREAQTQRTAATNEAAKTAVALAQSEKYRRQVEFNLYCSQLTAANAAWLGGDLAATERALDTCPTPLRNWEWNYLKRQCHPDNLSFQIRIKATGVGENSGGTGSEKDTYGQMSVSPDGSKLYLVAPGCGAAVFDTSTGERLSLTATNSTGGVFTRDGRWFIQAPDETHAARIVEVSTKKTVAEIPGTERPRRQGMEARVGIQFDNRLLTGGIVLNADENLLAVHTTNGAGVFTVPNGNLHAAFEFPDAFAMPLAFHPEKPALLVGCVAKDESVGIKLLRLDDKKELFGIARPRDYDALARVGVGNFDEGYSEPVASRFRVCELFCFDSSGDLLASLRAEPQGNQCRLEVWDVQTAVLKHRRSLNLLPAQAAFVGPSNLLFVSGFAEEKRVFGDERRGNGPDCMLFDLSKGEVVSAFHLDSGAPHSGRTALFNGWGGGGVELGEMFGSLGFAVSPDGGLAAVGTMDQVVHLLDLNKHVEVKSFRGHSAGVARLAFHPHAGRLYSSDTKAEARVWNTGAWLVTPSIAPDTAKWAQPAADANVVACSGTGFPGPNIKVANFDQRTVYTLPNGTQFHAFDYSLAPNGKVLATIETRYEKSPEPQPEQGSQWRGPPKVEASLVVLRDVQSGQELRQLVAPIGEILMIAFSPDGRRLGAVCRHVPGSSGVLVVWNLADGELLPLRVELEGLRDRMEMPVARTPLGSSMLCFSPDCSCVAVAVNDTTVANYRLSDTGAQPVELFRTSGSYPVLFNPKGDALLLGGPKGGCQLVAADSGKVLKVLADAQAKGGGLLTITPDGKRVVYVDVDHVTVWNLLTGRPEATAPCANWAASLSPDGKRLATITWDDELQMCDLDAAARVCTLPVKAASIRFSRLGHQLFGVSPDGKLLVLDGTPLRQAQ